MFGVNLDTNLDLISHFDLMALDPYITHAWIFLSDLDLKRDLDISNNMDLDPCRLGQIWPLTILEMNTRHAQCTSGSKMLNDLDRC